MTVFRSPSRLLVALLASALAATACSSSGSNADSESITQGEFASSEACFAEPELEVIDAEAARSADISGTELTLVAYDSFAVSEGIFEQFEAATGATVTVLTTADTGTMVSEAVLTAGDPVADVMWGIDNTFMCRALEADVFTPYVAAELDAVDAANQLDPYNRLTPVDIADVCINYWIDAIETDPPNTLQDLADPANASNFVTQNPETSAPGMAFLLATIAEFGAEGWEDYWEDLTTNGLAVTPGWSDAYYGEFVAGGGDRAIVNSYASSPVAELLFADPPVDTPPTVSFVDSCFRSIEFAGVLAGTDHPEAAAQLVDFLLSTTFQEDIALNMFVFPANTNAELPPEFVDWAELSDTPLTLAPEVIEANRDTWTERWTDIVLR